MNNLHTLVVGLLWTCFAFSQQPPTTNTHHHCHFEQMMDTNKKKKDLFEHWLKNSVTKYKLTSENEVETILEIPIIFHIIHQGESKGFGTHLGTDRIQEQIKQLNIDFNTTTLNYTGQGDSYPKVRIVFRPTSSYPSGKKMSDVGVNYIDSSKEGWPKGSYSKAFIEKTIKPSTQWDPGKYLNIWVCEISAGILGYASFPIAEGMPQTTEEVSSDGVVIRYTTIGSLSKPYDHTEEGLKFGMGRTLTHEVGHWLGLLHLWGDGGCDSDDHCNDTPSCSGPNFGCPDNRYSCGEEEKIGNFMDYIHDACMTSFSPDQYLRMVYVLQESPNRKGLINREETSMDAQQEETPSLEPTVFPSPVQGDATVGMTLEQDKTYDIEVFAFDGKLTWATKIENSISGHTQIRIPSANFPPGIYWIAIRTGTTVKTVKLSKT